MLVMASTILTSSLAEECRKAGTPVIMFNRTTGESGTWSVTGENLDGGREIADFLVAAGHDHFAFIAGIENSSTSRDREAGYSQRLLQHGKGKPVRSEEHTSELQSLMRISYDVFCLQKKKPSKKKQIKPSN